MSFLQCINITLGVTFNGRFFICLQKVMTYLLEDIQSVSYELFKMSKYWWTTCFEWMSYCSRFVYMYKIYMSAAWEGSVLYEHISTSTVHWRRRMCTLYGHVLIVVRHLCRRTAVVVGASGRTTLTTCLSTPRSHCSSAKARSCVRSTGCVSPPRHASDCVTLPAAGYLYFWADR